MGLKLDEPRYFPQLKTSKEKIGRLLAERRDWFDSGLSCSSMKKKSFDYNFIELSTVLYYQAKNIFKHVKKKM